MAAGDTERALKTFAALWQDGKEPAGILDELAGLMRDVLLVQVAPKGAETLISGVYDMGTLKNFAARMPGAMLMDAMNAVRAADTGGTDPRRAAEMCLVSLCVPETGDSLQGLKNRVSILEAALKNGAFIPAAPAKAETPAPKKEEPAPKKEPVKEKTPPPMEEEPPWYTDEDAPPAERDMVPDMPAAEPEPPAQEPEKPSPAPAPAVDDSGLWEALVKAMAGRMEMGPHAMLNTPTQVSGVVAGDTLTVSFVTPIAKMMLGTPAIQSLMQDVLRELTGRDMKVVFADKGPAPAAKPDMGKLDALSRFGNIKFE